MYDGKKVVITYGTYDLLHHGHIALLERAKKLGDYLIVGVTSDAFDKERGKLNVRQSLIERVRSIEDAGIADKIIVEEYRGQKISDIQKYGVDVFTVGSDWEGKFDYLKKYCEVVYLERTKGVSSTELREKCAPVMTLGCIGHNYLTDRLIRESEHVGGMQIGMVAGRDGSGELSKRAAVEQENTLEDVFKESDAVYISEPIDLRADLVNAALDAGAHVLCEAPLFLSEKQARQAYEKARRKSLVVMEAVKTRYLPAFGHLKLLLESGAVGEVKDINASFSHVFPGLDKKDRYQGSFYDLASYVLLPALSLLGTDYERSSFTCHYEGEFCSWTKLELLYECASATLRAGRGVKTEGDMVITGTDGYVYVPAPWWKTDYFEVRTEDLRNTKKYFYECVGEGQRYELFEFIRLINGEIDKEKESARWQDILTSARLVEKFDRGDVVRLSSGRFSFSGGETVGS